MKEMQLSIGCAICLNCYAVYQELFLAATAAWAEAEVPTSPCSSTKKTTHCSVQEAETSPSLPRHAVIPVLNIPRHPSPYLLSSFPVKPSSSSSLSPSKRPPVAWGDMTAPAFPNGSALSLYAERPVWFIGTGAEE